MHVVAAPDLSFNVLAVALSPVGLRSNQESMADPSQFLRVVDATLLIIFLFFAAIGIAGYALFAHSPLGVQSVSQISVRSLVATFESPGSVGLA